MNKESPVDIYEVVNTSDFQEFLQREFDNESLMKLKEAVLSDPSGSASLSPELKEKILLYDNDLAKENQRLLDDLIVNFPKKGEKI